MKVTFVGYQFLTDFDSRSHGPLLCAFCLCFHFKGDSFWTRVVTDAALHGKSDVKIRPAGSMLSDGISAYHN